MGVSLSIKNVPDALAKALRQRALANHRSLQRELMAIVEAAASSAGTDTYPGPIPPGLRESESRYAVAMPPPGGADDGLLTELDAIVAGSRWGDAALLSRDEVHDRELTRALDLDARAEELARARQRARRGGTN